jgi:hypothetical protein
MRLQLRLVTVLSVCLAPALAGSEEASPSPAVGGGASAWELPPAGSCESRGRLVAVGAAAQDVSPAPFQPGDVFELDRLQVLQDYLPPVIYENRERFFFEGMRLEIGPCYRDYAPPAFFREATAKFRGQAKLSDTGGLEGYTAGLPFPPDTIDPADEKAGLAWLWNVENRYQAAGFRGKFRVTDLVGRIGRAEPFEGEMFKILVSGRTDLADRGYATKDAKGKQWVAGGLFYKPFDAREYAWRQYRDLDSQVEMKRSDDLHAYLPQWRRVRRLPAQQVEGLYMPSFSVGVQPNQQLVVGGAAGDVAAGGGVGGVGSTIEAKRSGYEGLEFRPLLYRVRVLGIHDVLAPINLGEPVYPEAPDRDFGPWGLSFANDRWDLRRALVLEGIANDAGGFDDTNRMILYVDLQTLQPLYMATFNAADQMSNVGIYAGRWSEDHDGYPRWPDDPERPVRVIDSVGAAFANLSEAGSWRRESWDNVATPPDDKQVRRMLSVSQLTKRR